jgi:hypothetical protein
MQKPEVFALQRSGLNDFLFAPVGTEPNGMTLSLVSVFARLGSDPWREAGRLDRLPTAEAITSLARTIAGMPMSAWALSDATAIATRLIALLPGRSRQAKQSASASGLDVPRLIRVALVLAGIAFATSYMLGLFATPDARRFDAGRDGAAITSAPAAAPTATHGAAR